MAAVFRIFRKSGGVARLALRHSSSSAQPVAASASKSEGVSTGLKIATLGITALAVASLYDSPYKTREEKEATKKKSSPSSAQYNNLNIITLESKELCFTWNDEEFQYRLVIPKDGPIGEPEKSPIPPPAPKEEPAAAPAVAEPEVKKAEAPAPAAVSQLAEAPTEGFTQTEDGWMLAWKDKDGDLWVQHFPNKGKGSPAAKYVPGAAGAECAAPAKAVAKTFKPTPATQAEIDKLAMVTSLRIAVTAIERNLGVSVNTVGLEGFPVFDAKHKSALSRYLSAPVYAKIASRQTPNGFTLDQLIQSGIDHPDSPVGVWAGDKETYTVFAPLLDPIIAEIHHNYPPSGVHLHDSVLAEVDEMFNHVPVTRIVLSASRNLSDTRLLPAVTRSQRRHAEATLVKALASAQSGKYLSLSGSAEDLAAAGIQASRSNKFAESAGVNRDWPDARGVYVSGNVQAWINAEEMLRVELTEQGSSIVKAYEKLNGLLSVVEENLGDARFLHDTHLGYITAHPARLGTALEASAEVALPHVAALPDLGSRACQLGVTAERRGDAVVVTAGSTLGQSERSQLARLAVGIAGLASLERSLTGAPQ